MGYEQGKGTTHTRLGAGPRPSPWLLLLRKGPRAKEYESLAKINIGWWVKSVRGMGLWGRNVLGEYHVGMLGAEGDLVGVPQGVVEALTGLREISFHGERDPRAIGEDGGNLVGVAEDRTLHNQVLEVGQDLWVVGEYGKNR